MIIRPAYGGGLASRQNNAKIEDATIAALVRLSLPCVQKLGTQR
jgi:hypothetical protein